jgi:hypothetical protein
MSTMSETDTALSALFSADWLAQERAQRDDERARMTALRARLLATTRAAGAATVTARYEGGHDSGCVDEIYAEPESADEALQAATVEVMAQEYDADANAYVLRSRMVSFQQAAIEFFGWKITDEHGNWWDGDIETSGEVVWHVADDPDRIRGEHSEVTKRTETCDWGEDEGEDITLTDAADAALGPEEDEGETTRRTGEQGEHGGPALFSADGFPLLNGAGGAS